MHATIPKGNMGYDQYTVPGTVAVKTSFVAFVANIRPWPLVPFFQISVKNSELKTTHNTFRYCRVYFFRGEQASSFANVTGITASTRKKLHAIGDHE